ncbi:hypothetical protein NQ318_019345 [Aromia moschata]|uniref:Uncharacterized protein n=1 Tax=Aromia moschata TaxID=1265417 RepID=A0AAV8YC41_9CUCU|nr:hypothetical protein NQ318_019345 [Aromia moschata]
MKGYEVCKLSNETGNVAPDLATLRRLDLEGRHRLPGLFYSPKKTYSVNYLVFLNVRADYFQPDRTGLKGSPALSQRLSGKRNSEIPFNQDKSAVKGTIFESVEAVTVKATEVLNQLTEADFQHCFQQRKSRMERCRDRQGGKSESLEKCEDIQLQQWNLRLFAASISIFIWPPRKVVEKNFMDTIGMGTS